MWIYKILYCRDIYKTTPQSQIYNNLPREDSIIFLVNIYPDLHFEFIKKTVDSRYADIQIVMIWGYLFNVRLLYSVILNSQRPQENSWKTSTMLT